MAAKAAGSIGCQEPEFLHFPSQDTIVAYLEKHLQKKAYLSDYKIIKAVAEVFANSELYSIAVQFGVMMKLAELNNEFHLDKATIDAIVLNLTQVLQNCAREKILKLKKITKTRKKA